MCFSLEADLAVGVGLVPVAALSLREVRTLRELPFAALPLLFALHQLVEVVVWAGTEGTVCPAARDGATLAYLLVALPVLPTWVPLAVVLLEPPSSRRRVAPFVALGVAASTYLAWAVLSRPVAVEREPHALAYSVDLTGGTAWAVLYVAAVIGPSVLSGYPEIVWFGLLNLVGLTTVAVLYAEAFASLWCVWAALASVLVMVHMRRRRRLPDPHRLHGEPLVRLTRDA
ncbi:DUF6629 family protein [Nocardioides aurantiacus]|uniref:DUF6629 family protein n=1 Tax=Nocardioides aurantiacus TaxID=86796 RepID=UPI00403FB42C